MSKNILLISSLSIVVTLTACAPANTVLMPLEGNRYSAISTSESENNAMNGAMAKANETCSKQNKKLTVLNSQSIYQGAGKQLGAITEIAHEAAFFNSDFIIPSSKTDEDYKATIIFRCN